MSDLFLKIVNMSLSASYLVLAVLAARLLLRKAPKWVNVLLWGLVAVRLLCPFTLESALSLIPSAQVVSPQIMLDSAPVINTGIPAVNEAVNPVITEAFAPDPAASANPMQIWIPILAVVWLVGMAAMGEYTLFTWLRLRRRVATAVRVNGNVYLSDTIPSPFVLGIFYPKIYLPYGMTKQDMRHVLAHERTHIRRRDHWWKPLGFTLLTIHWFNPLLWLAYILLCRDIELACDEKVIQELGFEARADYSQALLNCSVSHRSIAACPVAFGEAGVKQRVKNVLTYRRPAFWIIVLSLILCLVVAVCFLTDPQKTEGLDWLQTLSAEDVQCIEYYCGTAAPDKQYGKFEEPALLEEMLLLLNHFDGKKAKNPEIQNLVGFRYDLTITMKDGTAYTVINHANRYLQIGEEYYEDTQYDLNTWNFSGTSALPEEQSESGSFYGVSLTVEEVTPTGATVVFTGTGEKPAGRLLGGNDYWVQVQNDGVWEDITKVPEPSFTMKNYDISNIRRHKIDWQWRYGMLPSGHYRIGKCVTYQDGTKPMESATVWAEFTFNEPSADAYSILSNLIPDNARAEAVFASGGGYNCFPQETQELVGILNSLEQSELLVSPAMSPTLSITLYANEQVTLHYNGMYVQFAFNGSSNTAPWAVNSPKLNAFMEKLHAHSPENSTYEIYNVAPLEDLPESYSLEEATIDKVVIMVDGDISANQEVWNEFITTSTSGIPATVRVMHYDFPNQETPGNKIIYDLEYDGTGYRLTHCFNGFREVFDYAYLRYFAGELGEDSGFQDSFECYVLTDNATDPWDKLSRSYGNHLTIYQNLIYVPKQMGLPWTETVELRLSGQTILTLSGSENTIDLYHLLRKATYLGYEPKTHFLGPELVLISDYGSSHTLRLALDSDLVLYNGYFYDYGPGTNSNGGINNLPVLLGMLGLEDWPEEVKQAYPNYFAEVGSMAVPPANDLFSDRGGKVINVWYPDWAYLEILPAQADRLLEALKQEAPNPTAETLPDVTDTVFTVHIAFDGGKEYDLAYMGQTEFYLRDFQTYQVYSFSSDALRIAVDNAISETKASLDG
nr:hypothetical protein [Oscillospiraceae bacterium]